MRDAVDAAEAKIVLLPPKKQALPSATDATDQALPPVTDPSSLPSAAMPRATTAEDDPFGPLWT
jgi:hypothetical protein